MDILNINSLNDYGFSNFNLSIKEGFNVIIGDNNSSKSTLFNIISCFYPTDNIVSINNQYMNKDNINNYIKEIGIVENLNKFSFLKNTVLEELSYPLDNLGYSKSLIESTINDKLKLFELDNIKDKKIKELTKLEKQKLLIVLALLHNPKILIIDSIFSYMEDSNKVIEILKNNKINVLYFTSSFNNYDLFDYVYILNNKEIIIEGEFKDIINNKILKSTNLELPFINTLNNKLLEESIINRRDYNIDRLVDKLWN